jgi:ankyrin repeat protein
MSEPPSLPPPPLPAAVMADFRRAFDARDAPMLRELLGVHAAARALIDAPLFPFETPALVYAASRGDVALVDVLLAAGADPNARTGWWAGGFHALHHARGEVAARLLAAGAQPDACAAANLDRPDLLRRMLDADPPRVDERGGDGQTPLHFARSREVVDMLLGQGADPDARDVDHRSTPAQWMLDRRRGAGRYELAAYLVARGATADIFLAAALGLTDRLRALLEADPSLIGVRTSEGAYGERPPSSFHIYTWTIGEHLSPLQVASQFEQHEALELLRGVASPRDRFLAACAAARAAEARALLREQPNLIAELSAEQARVLTDAAAAGNAAAVELMLELGFDAATRGREGGTLLHHAAWHGAAATIEVALRWPAVRALVDVRDATYDNTPLGWCRHGAQHCVDPAGDYPAVERLLLAAGARPVDELPQ